MADWTIITQGIINNATTSDLTFSGIPGTYQHLELMVNMRIGHGSSTIEGYFQLNGDSGSKYGSAGVRQVQDLNSGNPTRVTQYASVASSGYFGFIVPDSATAGAFCTTQIIIPNYANTAEYKTVLSRGGMGQINTLGESYFLVSQFDSTAAVTSINLIDWPSGGSNYWEQGTSYMLAGYSS